MMWELGSVSGVDMVMSEIFLVVRNGIWKEGINGRKEKMRFDNQV